LKLKTRLQVAFLLLAALCTVLTGWQSFEHSRNAIEQATFAQLTGIRESKKQRIEAYFRQIRDHIVTLAGDTSTVEAAHAFIAAQNRGGAPERRADQVTRHHARFVEFARRFRYSDIVIADAASGVIVYASSGQDKIGIDLRRAHSRLARAFAEVALPAGPECSGLADFALYDSSAAHPSAFLASPIRSGGRTAAVLLFEVAPNDINSVMTSGTRWEAEGLGRTGETYIVGDDSTMRSDSRFFIQDSAAYFRRLRSVGAASTMLQRIRERATTILIQKTRTEATIEALAGRTGTRIIDDYRRVSVLSSYSPLRIAGVHWVILAEIDANEALAPVAALRERLVVAGLALLLLAAGAGYVLARMISRPLVTLTAATQRFGAGGGFQRVDDASPDEIGVLARTFNTMARGMTESTERLRNLSTHLQTVREEERQGVAREIHDELGQALSTLKLDLALMREELPSLPAPAERRIASMSELCDTTIRAVRRIITQLRPRLLDDLGLSAAMEWQTEEFQRRTGIRCVLTMVPEEITLDPDRSTSVFRIFQETLTNIARHSGATRADIELRCDDHGVTLEVCDNGKGITEKEILDARSFGLLGIRERALYWGGSATITGSPGKGTRVSVVLPGNDHGSNA
jgi:signal transduction histidine kinase